MTAPPSPSPIDELAWLKANPAFRERPMTLIEFLGPLGLNIEKKTRARIREVLADIMGEEVSGERPTRYQLAMFTGAIGIGKTTVASIVLPYLVHWVLCLRDPQDFFDLLPGSRIAFMMMSTKASQAKEVLFGDIKARLAESPWFKKWPIDPNFKNQIRFAGDIWILPGDSTETTFEGYNILGGILDEADSHRVTDIKDYADEGFRTIYNRMSSRFDDRGFVLIIGQMKSSTGFAARKYEEFLTRDDAYAARLTIWESRGWDYYKNPDTGEIEVFYYDPNRKLVLEPALVDAMSDSEHLMKIPRVYMEQFKNNPEEALKDLAGMPPAVDDPFISLVDRIFLCRDRWVERYGKEGTIGSDNRLPRGFKAPDTLPRVSHIDIGYSGSGDAMGFAMGHIREMVDIEGEWKPHIVIDLMYRLRAAPGQEIMIADIRQFIYSLRRDAGYKLKEVTMDGFQSKDTEQQLNKNKFLAYYLSVDKEKAPYHDLREAIYEGRIDFPPYQVLFSHKKRDVVDILPKELQELMDTGKKIDHPVGGSKDVADAVAAVVSNLMGNTRYHKKKGRGGLFEPSAPQDSPTQNYLGGGYQHPALGGMGGTGTGMPLPPINFPFPWENK